MILKILKNKKLNMTENDKILLRKIRLMFECNEADKTYNNITEDEYIKNLKHINKVLSELEVKYNV